MPILNGIYENTPFDTEEIPQAELNIANKLRSNPLRWKGQFSPQLVQVLLHNYSNLSSVVFDPFVGSGTVLLESGMAGLAASGTEINPAAAMLAQTYRFVNVPIELRWFHVKEVASLLQSVFFPDSALLCGEPDLEVVKPKLLSLFSKTGNQFELNLLETLVTLVDFYRSDISVKRISKVWKNLKELVIGLPFSNQPIEVFLSDARETPLSDSMVDLVITSPPYINVFNYHQQYRASMETLNWNLLKVSRSEFGANRKHRANRFLTVIQFCLDIVQTLGELSRICKPDARLIFVVGRESMVKGTPFFNGELVTEICHRSSKFDLILKQQREFRNSFGQRIIEDILHFSPSARTIPRRIDLEVAREVAQEALEASLFTAPEKSKKDIMLALRNIDGVRPSPFFDLKDMKAI